jgi:hypothetical protein
MFYKTFYYLIKYKYISFNIIFKLIFIDCMNILLGWSWRL